MRDRAGAATRTEPVTDFASRIHWEQYRRMYGSPLGHSPYSPASFSGAYSSFLAQLSGSKAVLWRLKVKRKKLLFIVSCLEIQHDQTHGFLDEVVRGQRYNSQGGHGTWKTGNLVITFSRQGKHRKFCCDTGKNLDTQGKYFSVTQGKYLTVIIKIKSMFIFLNFKIF